MIISASRRTDIPAFYSEWMINRIKDGYCTVFNPFNRNQVKRVSLKPIDVDVIVFWTKNALPIIDKLRLIDSHEIKYYFQYTLVQYDKSIETKVPSFDKLKNNFIKLADRIGPEKVIWRYDPIIITDKLSFDKHIEIFSNLSHDLKNYTNRVVVSIVDLYKKTLINMTNSSKQDHNMVLNPESKFDFEKFIKDLAIIANENNLEIQSCAEEIEMDSFGINPGKCIDDDYIKKVFSIEVGHKKDKGQRKVCGCVDSIDIGVYDTCLHGCQYCYATRNHNSAIKNYNEHDPKSPSLLGWYDKEEKNEQMGLF